MLASSRASVSRPSTTNVPIVAMQLQRSFTGRSLAREASATCPSGIDIDHPYIDAAIDGELKAVRSNGQFGKQNTQLFISSATIGNLIAGIGRADDQKLIDELQDELLEAAMEMPSRPDDEPWDSTEGRNKAIKTIESGIKKGLDNPRNLPGITVKGPRGGQQHHIIATGDSVVPRVTHLPVPNEPRRSSG